MLCPVCGSDKTQVVKTRHDESDQARINRTRECSMCGAAWTTKEVPGEIYFLMQDLKENECIQKK